MRYFEMPKMNISMFGTENVITVASGTITPATNAEAAQNALVTAINNGNVGEGREAIDNIFTFTY